MKANLQSLRAVSGRAVNKSAALGVAAIAAVLASPLVHAAIDVAPVVTEITATKEPIGLVGIAILGVVVALLAFAMVRKSIRG